jgi:hypothetical protein
MGVRQNFVETPRAVFKEPILAHFSSYNSLRRFTAPSNTPINVLAIGAILYIHKLIVGLGLPLSEYNQYSMYYVQGPRIGIGGWRRRPMSSQMTILPQTCQKLSQHSGPRKTEILIFYTKALFILKFVSW